MKPTRFCAVMTLVLLLGGGAVARADAPLQLALWPPDVQLVPVEESVRGLRLEVWGSNAEMSGLELGFVHETTTRFSGISLGLASIVDGDATGLLFGTIYSYTADKFVGWSVAFLAEMDGEVQGLFTGVMHYNEGSAKAVSIAAIFNYTKQDFTGAQFALVNRAGTVKGLQLGLVNLADDMEGIQIGIWNEIASKENWKVIPLVNWKF